MRVRCLRGVWCTIRAQAPCPCPYRSRRPRPYVRHRVSEPVALVGGPLEARGPSLSGGCSWMGMRGHVRSMRAELGLPRCFPLAGEWRERGLRESGGRAPNPPLPAPLCFTERPFSQTPPMAACTSWGARNNRDSWCVSGVRGVGEGRASVRQTTRVEGALPGL